MNYLVDKSPNNFVLGRMITYNIIMSRELI